MGRLPMCLPDRLDSLKTSSEIVCARAADAYNTLCIQAPVKTPCVCSMCHLCRMLAFHGNECTCLALDPTRLGYRYCSSDVEAGPLGSVATP